MNRFYKTSFLPILLTACTQHYIPDSLSTTTNNTKMSLPKTTEAVRKGTKITPVTQKAHYTSNKVTSWNLSGGIAARNKNKGWSASLNWQQQGANRYHIRLSGPLGGGTIIVEKNGGSITYTDGKKHITSHNADELLQQQTGIRLPVQNLYYWVRGLPAPGGITNKQYDENQHLTLLKQSGYSIHYMEYTIVNDTALPLKIHLQGHGVTIKLVIKNWQI